MKFVIGTAAIAAAAVGASASTTVFASESAFVAQLDGPFFFDDFAGIQVGPVDNPLVLSGNGFVIEARGLDSPIEGDGFDGGLFNDPGLLSLNQANDVLRLDFVSGNVTAVGGNFFASDINFAPIPLLVTFELNDGTFETISTDGPEFRGYVNLNGISSLIIDAPDVLDGAGNVITPNWPAVDDLWVGRAIPSPGAVGLLGLAGLAAARRRR